MTHLPRFSTFLAAFVFVCSFACRLDASGSFYTDAFPDDQAITLSADRFPVVGDGHADDTEALQMAINAVQERSEYGILLVPPGRYRITDTVYVWKGIRLIGYGEERPEIYLGKNTPGFQGGSSRYLIHFASNRPREGQAIRDANPGTFYSALSNLNIVIDDGNPAAVGVRSHFAQHSFLAHIDFHTGSGKAGVEKVGNIIENCRFLGGDYGILTTKPSPSWPFVMVDSQFKGQRKASIRTEEAGLTLLRIQFSDTPTAILVNPDRAEELFLKDSTFTDISGPALVISDEFNARPQFNLENVVAKNTPVLATFRKSGESVRSEEEIYRISSFTHGLQIADLASEPVLKTTFEIEALEEMPAAVSSDIPPLPPQSSWANVKDFGAEGDGETDDTVAIRSAIEASRAVYFPTGRYRVTDTIDLLEKSVLVGLSPITTQILIDDYTPAFMGLAEEPTADLQRIERLGLDPDDPAVLRRFTPAAPPVSGSPVPLLLAPRGGETVITGIGLNTGGANPSAVALKWMAGENSMVNDVRFLGGHGTYRADGSPVPVYNENRTGDGDYRRRWDSQYASLWVTNGGGGTFKNIWSPSPYAQAGIYVSDTKTEGRVYQLSLEHHVRSEMKLRNVENWRFYAVQFEEESGEGPDALPIEIENCRNLLFANTYLYRVDRMTTPYPHGIRVRGSDDLTFKGIHVYSPTKFSFDATLYDQSRDVEIRSREIARLNLSSQPLPAERNQRKSPVRPKESSVRELAKGFDFIDGSATDSQGNLYFVDARLHRIYRWEAGDETLSLVRDTPFEPIALEVDTQDNLIVLAKNQRVFAFSPTDVSEELLPLKRETAKERASGIAIHPGHRWRDSHDLLEVSTAPSRYHFICPDGETYLTGLDALRSRGCYSLRKARPNVHFYLADEFGQKTWRYSVSNDGNLHSPSLFAEEGELDLAVDENGNVYIAAGQIHVYDRNGRKIDTIEVPQRPASISFGGESFKTLYICARSALYSIELEVAGQRL
ncbi:glycosyl hydrolase family 28-related protein [Pelagicoccus sp. SDUM812003]|uniref:glycosyl hydrolase family 28-related protein n=1 Tax=Pelagicoccus sp. SDUM812003 TaxID=3041267 RepID=UPI00280E3C84|nr:glycosyl hydrolase family 28-related protein [Pelagicoccus sp. SDUM812003]MDQ8204601.1 glycosyl hydrolase family 28-related protein [Pelagicoccus sp. SDUM812003]